MDKDRILPSEEISTTSSSRGRSARGTATNDTREGADGGGMRSPGDLGDDDGLAADDSQLGRAVDEDDPSRIGGGSSDGDPTDDATEGGGASDSADAGARADAARDAASDSGPAPGTCSKVLEGAAGKETNHEIPTCCTPTNTEKKMVDEVFRLMNEHREANGLRALKYDLKLEAAIQGHCRHMSQHPFFDHGAPEASVSSPWARAKMCGGKAGGENIAMGQRSAAQVMQSWKTSPGHNANMLSPDHRRVGIGYRKGYWGQLFGS